MGMFSADFERHRKQLTSYKLPALVLTLMLVAVIGAFFAVSTARNVLLRSRPDLPSIVHRVPWLAPSYLDRAAITEQLTEPPQLVRSLLWPALGAPALLDPDGYLDVVFDRPHPRAQVALLPREALAELDEHLYTLPPMPGGESLIAARMAAARARGQKGSLQMVLLPEERRAIAGILRDAKYQAARAQLLERVKNESHRDARASVERFRAGVARIVARDAKKLRVLFPQNECSPLGVGTTCVLRTRMPADIPAGLYALALLGPDGSLVDFQMNAVYRPRDAGEPPSFILAGDMQWGDAPNVAGAALSFVSLMNALDGAARAPEFIVMAGDVVDGQFGSALSLWSKLFGGAENYTRDFLQAWLVLAALRVPIFVVPGNHDGYRFEDAVGELRSDGLLLFQSTFGPLYHSIDRPPWRFVMVNTYDLPSSSRTIRRGEGSNIVERFSDRLNVLNWGGGIGAAQHEWLRYQLGLDAAPASNLEIALVMHHDPRGGYPALRRDFQERQHQWTTERHVPIGTELVERPAMSAQRAPRFADTEEIHNGYYTPLRDERTLVRGREWFDLGVKVSVPDSLGWPGWSKYQQGWHSPAVYGRGFTDLRRYDAKDLVSPEGVLRTIIDGRVRVMFKAHDNRFAHARIKAGESIFTQAAGEALLQMSRAERKRELQNLQLLAPLDVYHVADLSDFNSDGHGFFWVARERNNLAVLEIDHW
jgi:hypothetical protein